jgi:hypothetical protein
MFFVSLFTAKPNNSEMEILREWVEIKQFQSPCPEMALQGLSVCHFLQKPGFQEPPEEPSHPFI